MSEIVSGLIRILTVDDHAFFREGLAMVLATQPDMVLVAEASSGREAIEQFRAYAPDITLMDLQMPMMTGLEAMAAIRKEYPEAKIIILKASLDKELLETIRAVHTAQ